MLQLLNSEALTFGPFIYVILCISLVVVGVEFYSLHRSLKHLRSARKAVESKVQAANCNERFHPPATVIVPCRGLDLELDENVRAILTQHYPRYSVVFVVDSQLDPAYNALRRMVNELPQPLVDVRIVENRMLPKTSGKVSALTAAVDAGVEGEVLVFADSDIRPAQDWLSSLVDPLKDDAVGVSTAYRWCVPAARTFAATFQSAWNAFGTAAFLSSKTVFAWGGSMALRRTVFERLRIRDRWKGEISDDAVVTSAVRRAGLQIRFAPCSMVPTFVKPTLKEFLDFAVRQLAIVRAYVGRKIWLYGLIPLMLYAPLPLLGLVLTAYGLALGSVFIPAVMLTLAFPMDALRSYLRILTFTKFMTHHTRLLKRHLPSTIAVGVLVLWVMLYAAVKANFAKAVEWRDRTYALRYPVQRRV